MQIRYSGIIIVFLSAYFEEITDMKTILKYLMAIVLVGLACQTLNAQYMNLAPTQKVEVKPQRWFVGGIIGGSFSSYGGSFEIAPIVGYKITPEFHMGTRITYIYSSYKDYGGQRYNLHDYGASLFGRYLFYKFAFAQVEYEALSLEVPAYAVPVGENTRKLLNSLFVGGGIVQPMGGRGFATIAVLFNLLETEYSNYVYSNPIIRIGFGVGF